MSEIATTAPVTQQKSTPSIKHDWYQTELQVIITIMLKNADKEKVSVTYDTRKVMVSSPIPNTDVVYELDLLLAHSIVTEGCFHVVTPSKIEVKLQKITGLQWLTLEGSQEEEDIKHIPQDEVLETTQSVFEYPSSSLNKKNWDQVRKEIKKEEDESPNVPMSQLFQTIYGEGNDDLRKAMNKSFVESGGTVLSTNWEEVSKDKVPMKAPDGLVFKKWKK